MAQSILTAHMEWKEDRGVIQWLQVQSIEGLQVAILCRNLLQVLGLCHRRKHPLNLLPLPAEYQTCAAGAVSPTQTPNAQITCSAPSKQQSPHCVQLSQHLCLVITSVHMSQAGSLMSVKSDFEARWSM